MLPLVLQNTAPPPPTYAPDHNIFIRHKSYSHFRSAYSLNVENGTPYIVPKRRYPTANLRRASSLQSEEPTSPYRTQIK